MPSKKKQHASLKKKQHASLKKKTPREPPPEAATKSRGAPSSYIETEQGLWVPTSAVRPPPVKVDKIEKGLDRAQQGIRRVIAKLAATLTKDEYEVAEIQLQLGFNADGKFMGFGVGTNTTVTVKIRPVART
jgi:hypothetical protein